MSNSQISFVKLMIQYIFTLKLARKLHLIIIFIITGTYNGNNSEMEEKQMTILYMYY
jgi:hypothetical protein